MAEASRDAISQKNFAGEQMSDDLGVRRTRRKNLECVNWSTKSTNASDNPLCSTTHFWLPRSRLKGHRCHNLMHFVHKLMRTPTRTQN